MTPEKREIVWRFIKHLNRIPANADIREVVRLAEKAVYPDASHAEQEAAMVRVAQLIGEYEP